VNNPKAFDVQFVDFDGVRFHLSTLPEDKSTVLLSMGIRCWHELAKYGAQEVIQREYSSWLAPSVEPDYNVSLLFDLRRLPSSAGMHCGKYSIRR
jgi:actin related protein 2/3 complex, subunit 2